MSRAVIVCGAKIKDYEAVSSYFRDDDFFIYCDSGLVHEDRFISPVDSSADLIIGDFDSHEKPDRNTEIIILPHEKDDTDSMYAIKETVKRGFDEVVLVGAVGDRFDHSLVNVYALLYLYERDVKGMIVDDYSEMVLIGNKHTESVADDFEYFSLVAVSGTASGVSIKNALYELEDGIIEPSYQYATSNEPIKGKGNAVISLDEGYLLLIRDRY